MLGKVPCPIKMRAALTLASEVSHLKMKPPYKDVGLARHFFCRMPSKEQMIWSSDTVPGFDCNALQILDADKYQYLLNLVHQRVETARNGQHLLHQLGSVQAFIGLAEHEIMEPPIFRYLMHILLRCLARCRFETNSMGFTVLGLDCVKNKKTEDPRKQCLSLLEHNSVDRANLLRDSST